MRKNGYIAGAMLATVFCGAALADDYPPRKSGLWEVTSQAEVGHATTTKMCIDADTDLLFHKLGPDFRSIAHCTKNDVKVDGDAVTAESVCKVGNSTLTTTSVTKFDGDSAYHTDITSHLDPAVLGKSDTTISQDGKWSGDCPPDMKPGDIIVHGFKINAKTLNMLNSFVP
jgi:Protein of unknown function (DUF3617)